MTTPIVFVVDQDAHTRESLGPLIRGQGWEAETFACARAFLSRARAAAPSCLVLDVDLPDIDGLELQSLVADRTDMPIIFITYCRDVQMSVRAMKAGAVEFLTKPLDYTVLLGAIRHAIDWSRGAFTQEAQMRVLMARFASLSRREREVMALVASGRLNKQVASALGISEITVKAHRGSVMRKTQAGSLAALVNMAVRLDMAQQYQPAPLLLKRLIARACPFSASIRCEERARPKIRA